MPFLQKYDQQVIVVKYGGNAMGDEEASLNFARDIVLLEQSGMKPVVVHGGGPQIGNMLERLNIKSEFRDGLRVTSKETADVAEMVLSGAVNKHLVSLISRVGGKAIGLSGKDGGMVVAEKFTGKGKGKKADLGYVGDPKTVNTDVLDKIIKSEIIPVIAPVATSVTGETYNINADTFAGAIAGALRAKRLILLTDVAGVLNEKKELIEDLTRAEALKLIKKGTISGGMIPKVETCFYALDHGVEAVVILDGKVPHAVLLELFTVHGAGTLMR
ncbi:MAG: acetylglutamate kinase [Pseudomonadota bacterium]